LEKLEEWAITDKRDALIFWIPKILATLVSAGAVGFAHLDMPLITAGAGAIGSLCVLVDGLNPGGMLRNIHHQAFHDLRSFQHEIGAR
jgi:hypothetical protein